VRSRKPHFSVSELKCYLTCPEQWYHRYVVKTKKPMPSAVVEGLAYDDVLSHLHKSHPTMEARRAFVKGSPQAMKQTVEDALNRFGDIEYDEGETRDALIADVLDAVNVYLANSDDEPTLAIQEWFHVDFEGLPWQFIGVMDRILQGVVVDNKLFGRTPTQEDVDEDLQLTAYALGYMHQHGSLPQKLRLDCVIKNKVKKFVQLETTRTQADVDRFLRILVAAAKAMNEGLVIPRPIGWQCKKAACQYWPECHERW